MKQYPRLLVLSNNSFSKSNSNGRTLGSLLQGWPKDRLAQFCISTDTPDLEVCTNYYCVTDSDMLRATCNLKPAHRRSLLKVKTQGTSQHVNPSSPQKTALTMIFRQLLWNFGIWRGKEFWGWIDAFRPEVILIQSGDSYFMHDLALKIRNRTKAKLCMFNTEAYCFFKTDYIAPNKGNIEPLLFYIYNSLYRRHFTNFMKYVDFAIHGNLLLQHDYDKEFNMSGRSDIVYTASEVKPSKHPINTTNPSISYIGNLGVGRYQNIVLLSEELRKIHPNLKIDVYGVAKRSEIARALKAAPAIDFHGFVTYDKVKEIISKSDILLHVELPPVELIEQLRYAFTTKIADSLSSGRLFLMIAPNDMACGKYIQDTRAALYAQSIDEGVKLIHNLIEGHIDITSIMENAVEASKNHNSSINVEKFRSLIASI